MANGKDIIFVIDDDEGVRQSLQFALELEDIAVRTCASGEELLQHPELPQARCLILDYEMPAMDGLQVLDHLVSRQISAKVIMITSFANEALRRRTEASGVLCMMGKTSVQWISVRYRPQHIGCQLRACPGNRRLEFAEIAAA